MACTSHHLGSCTQKFMIQHCCALPVQVSISHHLMHSSVQNHVTGISHQFELGCFHARQYSKEFVSKVKYTYSIVGLSYSLLKYISAYH